MVENVKSATKPVVKTEAEVKEVVKGSKQATLQECLAQLHKTKAVEVEAKKIEEEAIAEARKQAYAKIAEKAKQVK